MTRYIIRRLIYAAFIVWGCATVVFFLLRAVPGDPVSTMLGREYTPAAAAQLRQNLGLDQPVYVQYFKWMGNMAQGLDRPGSAEDAQYRDPGIHHRGRRRGADGRAGRAQTRQRL
jgi:ABC-type dipeptide/oligopeptide/nickel transport system permease component